MFEKYLEPKFHDRMPYTCADYQGEPLAFGFALKIPALNGGEYIMPFGRDPLTGKNTIDQHSHFASLEAGARITLPGQDDAYAEFARQGFPPQMYKLAMERTGIDYIVVYPSAGLLTTAVPDLEADRAAASPRL